MIKDNDLKETKRILIVQLVLSVIYFLSGMYMLIVNIINKNIGLNQELNIVLSLIGVGGGYAVYCFIILINPKKVRNKTIKAYDPSNKDIKEKSIRNAYYFYLMLSIILIIISYNEKKEDVLAIIFGILFFVVLFQFINMIYFKIKYNSQNKEEREEIDDQ